ncbi:hypothetical protein [Pseudonocardia sp. ICBG601]|uniref:hypothetical protein n=1 Tax=Pseudonocardia sp. ICBG601 TaxID=2846759 RepID=UPI001CF70767|nr:hypothetical protein [Pseudonocardia sp. ICBG601]
MRRRHDHRGGTWRWQPRPRPVDTATETTADAGADVDVGTSAAADSGRAEYTTGQLTWRLGELGFTPPRRARTDNDTAQDGDAAA